MNKSQWARSYALYGAAGFQFAALVGVLAVAGGWADERWDTSPWLRLTGVIVGSIAGFIFLWRLVQLAGSGGEE